MVDAMAHSLVSLIPDAMYAPAVDHCDRQHAIHLFMSNDAFYFGVLPIIAEAASAYGIDAAEIGRLLAGAACASAQPASAFHLSIGWNGRRQLWRPSKFTIKW